MKTKPKPKESTRQPGKNPAGARRASSQSAPKTRRVKKGVPRATGSASAGFNVKNFCKRFRVVRPDLTRMTGYSLRAVDDWAAGQMPGTAARKQLKELSRLFDALAEIMEPDYVGEWLKTPNDAFDGSTPLQVIERGETDRIWRMIHIIETGEPL